MLKFHQDYTNQSESVNSILAAKKSALGDSKKEDVRLSCFVQSIWKSVVDHQSLEIEKAICDQSNEFPLADHAEYLTVSIEDWYNMPQDGQESYVREFRNMNQFSIDSKKLITIPAATKEVPLATETLSIQLPDFIPTVLHVKDIESNALRLLNLSRAISEHPTLGYKDNDVKTFFVAGEKQEHYIVPISKKKKFQMQLQGVPVCCSWLSLCCYSRMGKVSERVCAAGKFEKKETQKQQLQQHGFVRRWKKRSKTEKNEAISFK